MSRRLDALQLHGPSGCACFFRLYYIRNGAEVYAWLSPRQSMFRQIHEKPCQPSDVESPSVIRYPERDLERSVEPWVSKLVAA